MARSSHNAALKLNAETQASSHHVNGGFQDETIARAALTQLSNSKEWGSSLEVSRQQVNQWKNGERIPETRRLQIVRVAKAFFMDLHKVEDAIDRCLLETYGTKESM